MADFRCWNKEIVIGFINVYKQHPCLWQIKNKSYNNRNLKKLAYDTLVEYCKNSGFPEANRDFVVKKIQSLRGSFRKELKKVKENWKYVPSLWYFEHLLFVKDEEIPAASFLNTGEYSDTEEQITELQAELSLEPPVSWEPPTKVEVEASENEEHRQQQDEQQSVNQKPTPIYRNRFSNRRRKRTLKDTRIEFMKACSTALKSQKQLSEFDLVGMNIAKKLQRMDPTQALYAESVINSVLLKGLKNQLHEDTRICTDLCHEVGKVSNITIPTLSPQYRITPSPSSSMSIPGLSTNKSEDSRSNSQNNESPSLRDLTDAEMQILV